MFKPAFLLSCFIYLFLSSISIANAQIYKTIDANGKITYTDRPKSLAPTLPLPITTHPAPPPPRSYLKGLSNFVAYTTSDSSILPFLDSPSDSQKLWMHKHFWRIFAFSPYFDSKLSWSSPAWLYKDAYAIYPSGNSAETLTLENASQFILKDSAGNPLFIPYGCQNGICPQYAADIGNQAFRNLWISQARNKVARGYKGIHVDDVNLDWRISNGVGNPVMPIDPRTGIEMTLTDWRRYFAEFTEQIRAEFPKTEIVHNSLWWVPDTDPYAARQLKAANIINIERGVIDDGLKNGNGPFGFETLLSYVDRRHSHKTNVLYFAYGKTQIECEYNLATYYLTSSNNDGTTCLYRNNPSDWWEGYDTVLGSPIGARYKLDNGIFQRDYESGVVLVSQPGTAQTTVTLSGKY